MMLDADTNTWNYEKHAVNNGTPKITAYMNIIIGQKWSGQNRTSWTGSAAHVIFLDILSEEMYHCVNAWENWPEIVRLLGIIKSTEL